MEETSRFHGVNAAVIRSTCRERTRDYGMTVREFEPGVWSATWAFEAGSTSADDAALRRSIEGMVTQDGDYPGCPYCSADSFAKCSGCGSFGCWNTRESTWSCPGCSASGVVTAGIHGANAAADG